MPEVPTTLFSLPLTPPLSYSADTTWPPTDPRFIPPESGYSHWTDEDGVVHVIYAPDVHLPLPPAYQQVDTMGVREAVAVAVAAEETRLAAGQPGDVQLRQPQEPGSPVHPQAPPLPQHLQPWLMAAARDGSSPCTRPLLRHPRLRRSSGPSTSRCLSGGLGSCSRPRGRKA